MASLFDPKDKEFRNWIKGALAVKFAKEGLTDFVQKQIENFHEEIYSETGKSTDKECKKCTTANLLTCPTNGFCKEQICVMHDKKDPARIPNKPCPKRLCEEIRDEISRQHRFGGPSWKNTDAQQWCRNSFEVAKCYMPPDGYTDKKSLLETDFNGTLSIIINHKSFNSKMKEHLNKEPNVCSKARVVGREVRHSPDLRLSDEVLDKYIEDLQKLLQDSRSLWHDKTAREAVNKLNQLKKRTLVISSVDITEIIDDHVRATITSRQQEALDAIQNYLDKMHTASVDALDKIMAARDEALDSIKKKADEEIERLAQHGSAKDDEELLQDLRKDLIRLYRENDSLMSVSPLDEDNAVPLIEFYVQPPMFVYKTPHTFVSRATEEDKAYEKHRITSYKQLFSNNDGKAFRNIYVEGDAGMGKTVFAQKLAITWCQAHDPDLSQTSKFTTDETENMQNFDLLFLLYLRDSSRQCKLQDLITTVIADKLFKKSQYPDSLLERFLNNKKVLVILDGLDEWSHPDPESCSKKPEVPHNFFPPNCSVITTTRRWKFSVAGLRPNNIDRHVEISKLDGNSSEQLKLNAIELLNRSRSKHTGRRSVQDFDNQIGLKFIWAILFIPYILLHLICIWFDGLPVGKSICEVYSNIIELKFRRGLGKPHVKPPSCGTQDQGVSLPSCMNKNKMCLRYKTLIKKLAEVAFKKLFADEKESRLVFDRDAALQYLTEEELRFCVDLGLLCQTKNKDAISMNGFKLFFPLKTIQEFFAGIYIASSLENTSVPTVTRACTSIAEILEMSEVFVFVCGMNPEAYSSIFQELKQILESDEIAVSYRSEGSVQGQLMLLLFQSVQLRCLHENGRNLNRNISLCLFDAFLLDKDITENIITLLNSSEVELKSIYAVVPENFSKIEDGVLTNLEALFCYSCDLKEKMDLDYAMKEFSQSLKTLHLLRTKVGVRLIKTIKTVYTLKLHRVALKHEDIKQLFKCFCKNIKYLNLCITCSDHKVRCDGCDLDLVDLKNLTTLELYSMPVCDLRVTSSLKSCSVNFVRITDTGLKHFLNGTGTCLEMEHLSLSVITSAGSRDFSLDLSSLSSLRELSLSSVPIQELKIPTQGPHVSSVQNISLKHTAIKNFFSDIAKNTTTRHLSLSIKCLDCGENCSGFIIDLSSLSSLSELSLCLVPIQELKIPAQGPKVSCLQTISMKHTAIDKLFSDTAKHSTVDNLQLSCIKCMDCGENCTGSILDLSSLSSLHTLSLCSVPIQELKIPTQGPSVSSVQNISMKHTAIEKFFSDFAKYRTAEHLRLSSINCIDHGKDCSGSILDLSSLSSLHTLSLNLVPVHELKIPIQGPKVLCLQTLSMKHSGVKKSFSDIAKFLTTENLKLSSIKCLDCGENCSGSILDLSSLNSLQQLNVSSVPVKELKIPTQGLPVSEVKNVSMKHSAIEKFFSDTGKSPTIKKLALSSIKCLDCGENCSGSILDLSSLRSLRELSLNSVPIKELKISTVSEVKNLSMKHSAIEKFFSDTGKSVTIKKLALSSIKCLDCGENCSGFILDLSSLSSLRELSLSSVPIKELKIPTQCLLVSEVKNVSMKHSAIEKLFSDTGKSPTIKKLALSSIKCMDCGENCSGFDLDISSLHSLQCLNLNLDSEPIKRFVKPPQKFVIHIEV